METIVAVEVAYPPPTKLLLDINSTLWSYASYALYKGMREIDTVDSILHTVDSILRGKNAKEAMLGED